MEHLLNVLHHDLKETGCDSLVIVYHHQKDLSKFSNLEKYGVMKLTYDSVEGFHSALQQIIISGITKNNEQFAVSKEDQKLAAEIQDWFHLNKTARIIQTWFYRKKFRKLHPILNKIYSKMTVFCQILIEEKGKEAVRKYNILLRGQTVNVIVKLIKLQNKMDEIKIKLQRSINRSSNDYSELMDDLNRYNYCEKINLVLESLTLTKDLVVKHKEIDIEWLKVMLEWAKDVIDQVWKWLDKYRVATNSNEIVNSKVLYGSEILYD